MRRYRILLDPIAQQPPTVRCTIQINAWDPATKNWQWLPIEHWDHTAPTPDGLSPTLDTTLRERGWRAAKDLPSNIDAPMELPVEVQSYRAVLDTVARARAHLAAKHEQLETVMHNVVADIPSKGSGRIGATAIAESLGFTRVRIYQIINRLIDSMRGAKAARDDLDALTDRERETL